MMNPYFHVNMVSPYFIDCDTCHDTCLDVHFSYYHSHDAQNRLISYLYDV